MKNVYLPSLFFIVSLFAFSNAKKDLFISVDENETLKIDIPVGSIAFFPTEEKQIRVRVHSISPDLVTLKRYGKEITLYLDVSSLVSKTKHTDLKLEGAKGSAEASSIENNITFIKNGQYVNNPSTQRESSLTEHFAFSNDISFEIEIPNKFNLSVLTGSGNISMNRPIEGNVDVETRMGDISLSDIYGNLQTKVSGGKISIGKVNGDATLQAETGDITVCDISGAVVIKTDGGNIKMCSINGPLDVKTTNGKVNIEKIEKKSSIFASMGDIRIGEANGMVSVTTNMGGIVLQTQNAQAKLFAKAGNISVGESRKSLTAQTDIGDISIGIVNLSEKETISLSSKNGNVELSLKSKAKANVSFNIQNKGVFQSPFLKNKSDDKQGSFSIGSGGAIIQLKTVDGNIALKSAY